MWLQAVLRAAAKAVLELLRLGSFSVCGHQQALVDLSYMMVVFESNGLAGEELSECLQALFDAAAERCSGEAAPLPAEQVARMVAVALGWRPDF